MPGLSLRLAGQPRNSCDIAVGLGGGGRICRSPLMCQQRVGGTPLRNIEM